MHETINFIQGYMCQSTGGVCMRQVALYRVTCVRVLGECVGEKLILYRATCARVLGSCVGDK